MRVYKQLCDRCSQEFAVEGERPYELLLTAKYYPDDRPSLFASRHRLELCEACRVQFGEWVGKARLSLPGLVSEVDHAHPENPVPEAGPTIPAQASFRVLVLTKLGGSRTRAPQPAPSAKPPKTTTTITSQEP